jgi:hypothetical protein
MNFLKGFDAYQKANKYNLDDALLEALRIEEVRPYIQEWEKNGGRERYKEIFDNKWRIYIPIESNKSDIQLEVEEVLTENGYEVVDYHANKAKKIGDEKTNFENLPKIGRLLNRFKKDLATVYANDKDTKSADDSIQIVISRHPYDIAGMTTDRRWNSCMDIRTGMNMRYVMRDVKKGTIVAYVIKKEDTNINDPINRLLIKPFVDGEKTMLGTDGVYFSEEHGDREVVGFRDTVENWLETKQGEVGGEYELDSELYPDGVNVINPNTKVHRTLSKRFDYVSETSGKFFKIKDKKDLWGIADLKGNILIQPTYNLIMNTSNILICKQDSEFKLFDLNGKSLSDKHYTGLKTFGFFYILTYQDGVDIVHADEVLRCKEYKTTADSMLWYKPLDSDLFGVYYKFKDYGVESKYEDVKEGSDYNIIIVKENGKWGMVKLSRSGEIYVIATEYDEINIKNRNLYCRKGDKWGILNSYDGEVRVPFEYDFMEYDEYNYSVVVSKDGKWGVINTDNQILIPVIFPVRVVVESNVFGGDMNFVVDEQGHRGVVDIKKGDVLVPIKYDKIFYTDSNDYLRPATEEGKQCIYHLPTAKMIIPAEYDFITMEYNHFIVEKSNGSDTTYGVYDIKGAKLYDTIFTHKQEQSTFTMLSTDNKVLKISNNGIEKDGF